MVFHLKRQRLCFMMSKRCWKYDEFHSAREDRFRILGRSNKGNVLLVVHCIRDESVIRIISSRRATATEKAGYERSVGL